MFIHIFAFRWQSGATEAQKSQAAEAIRALQGQIPGLLSTHVGANVSQRSQGYSFGGVMHFTDQAAFEAYNIHPAHQALLAWLMPLVEPLEVDFAV